MVYTYKATVIRVVDGDSIRMSISVGFGCHLFGTDGRGMDIRLFGVDCPETRGGTPASKAHGLLAKAYVEEHLKVGETYEITTHERGKFGRYLATIRLSKRRTINDLLVKSLLGVPYHGQNKNELKALHEFNRKELVKQGLLE